MNIFSGISFDQTVHKKYDFEKTDFAGFQDFLCTIDWTSLFSADDSVDGMWETFENFFQYGMYLYTPKRVPVSKKSAKWSAKTQKLYLRKKRFWHTYRRNRTRISRMLYNEASKEAKEASDLDVFKREKRCLKSANIKQLYGYINSKLTSKNAMPPLILNGQIFETSENKANVLQDQFCSVFTRDDGNLPHFEKRTDEIFDKIELTDDIVLRAIKSFPGKISSGPDGIPSFLLKKLASSVLEPLKFIFDKSLQSGNLPKQWLVAKVVPIYKKKGSNSDPINYRPVSLTSVACKILEKIIKNQFLSFLLKNKLITEKQHGFLSKRSTVTNLLSTVNSWFRSRSKNQNIHAVYTDFSKAFDTVSHEKLLFKLSKYGCAGEAFKWIKSFLSSRTQFVCIENEHSRTCKVISGVPQGTVLGPLLFLIFINDLVDVILHCSVALYADDAKIFKAESSNVLSSDLLQEDLNRVYEWAIEWQLLLAIQKCSVFIFGSLGTRPQYMLGNNFLDHSENINDLGVILSTNQKTSEHCRKVANKTSRRCASIFRAFKCRNYDFLVDMLEKFVRPSLEYGCQVWSPHLLKDIDCIENVQRRFTKRFPGLWHTPYTERLKLLNLESLEKRRIIADLTTTYKIINKKIDLNFDDFFKYSPVVGTRGHSLKLAVDLARTDTIKNSFAFRVPKIWNSLPSDTVSAKSLSIFRKRLAKVNLDNYLTGRGVS